MRIEPGVDLIHHVGGGTGQREGGRTKEGLTKKEAVRCLKRYVAREVYSLLPHEKLGLDSP
jgi:hypothetical protein